MDFSVNYIAVLVATLIHMALGFAWYGKSLFGTKWIALIGFSKEEQEKMQKQPMGKTMVLMLLSSLALVYVLALFISWSPIDGALGGVLTAGLVSFGVLGTTMLGSVMWEKKPWALYTINIGYYLVSFTILGALLGYWR